MEKIPTFKLLLVGNPAVGKTTFVKRHRTGEFEENYIPTIGVEVHPLTFNTTRGPVCFNVWDTAGQEKFGGIKEGFYLRGDCAIIMFDVTDKLTFKSVPNWLRDIATTCGTDIPICVCGNKVDREMERMVKAKSAVSYTKKKKLEYFDLSAKNNYNFEKPFLSLAKKLTGDPNLEFIELPDLHPPETYMSDESKIMIEENFRIAMEDNYEGEQDDDI